MKMLYLLLFFSSLTFSAQIRAEGNETPATTANMHPTFEVRDITGANVIITGEPPESTTTCGGCHDVGFINTHNSHGPSKMDATCFDCHVVNTRQWTEEAVDITGKLLPENIGIKPAGTRQCGSCHGIVGSHPEPPTIPPDFESSTATDSLGDKYGFSRYTGSIFSGSAILKSYLNIAGKKKLKEPFDIHANRLLDCTSCHYAINNPAKAELKKANLPHLTTDPRLPSISDYIHRPNHTLNRPQCTSCHNPMMTHRFLPHMERHMEVVDCESCHIPKTYGPVVSWRDNTVVNSDGIPMQGYRNLDNDPGPISTRHTQGFEPFLLPYSDATGANRVGPFNLAATWYWLDDQTGKKVPMDIIRAAFLSEQTGKFAPDIIAALDENSDDVLSSEELILKTDAQVRLIANKLRQLGVGTPVIRGDVEAYPINHGVVNGKDVLRDCTHCHGNTSAFSGTISIAPRTPGGIRPVPQQQLLSLSHGQIENDAQGGISWTRESLSGDFYLFGHSRENWSDRVGLVLFLFSVLAAMGHGAYRLYTRKHRNKKASATKRVYLYSAYERIWHWLMAASVLVLIITGLEIHYPDSLQLMGFSTAVTLHNYVAIVLVINGFLSLFYHLASAAIKQFIPSRKGLIPALLAQIRYYSQGIFMGHPHPSEKSVQRKLNPLQQITYLGLLNVLFPLQVITGLLIWSSSKWPELTAPIGGLTIVGPVHNFGSWLFMSFLVVHLYLTTTGHTPFSHISAMVDGYDELDLPEATKLPNGGKNV